MDDFFHGWRPKIGVVALVMALVFVGGWMRSLTIAEVVRIRQGDCNVSFVTSYQGNLALITHQLEWNLPDAMRSEWNSLSSRNGHTININGYIMLCRDRKRGTVDTVALGEPKQHYIIPYWPLVLLFTLLSAYLLLIKPRVAKKMDTSSDVKGVGLV